MNPHYYAPAVPLPALPNGHYPPRRYPNPAPIPATPHSQHSHNLPVHPHQHPLQHHHTQHQPHPIHQSIHPHLTPSTPPVSTTPTHHPIYPHSQTPPPYPQTHYLPQFHYQPQTIPTHIPPAIVSSSYPPDPLSPDLPSTDPPSTDPPSPVVTKPLPFTIPPLPWLSVPDEPFPPRRSRIRRTRLTIRPKEPLKDKTEPTIAQARPGVTPLSSDSHTPSTTKASSEIDSTNPSTPTSLIPINAQSQPPVSKPVNPPPAVPFLPIPAVPVPPVIKPVPEPAPSTKDQKDTPSAVPLEAVAPEVAVPLSTSPPPPAPVAKTFSSWADLVKSSSPVGGAVTMAKINGSASLGKSNSLAEVLKGFDITPGLNVSLPVLEPRGLINTGNMCFMNAILQMLMFCGPFYSFLDLLGKQVAHNFKGDTPLIDAMILFLREFRTVGTQASAAQLSGFKEKEYLEAFGDPFAPEFVYGALREIQRFSSMRRGHQHDAEEFLGFLLDELHEETVRVLQKATTGEAPIPVESPSTDDGWLEVGPKQKVASTRTTSIKISPITKIFGGELRSEFRVPGLKPSVTLEPYQPLQLDIQSPHVSTIIDALKQLTKPEIIHGDFNSPRGPGVTATKQVYIETLPPVLILHLKRFQYDNKGGTQKIWKKIGYPLILDIPREIISPTKRSAPLPKYRLIGVVYHHGKSASGGHYTVDVQRQDGKNWIRFDDTLIQRVLANEVKVDVKEIGTLKSPEHSDDGGWKSVNGSATPSSVNGGSDIGPNENHYGKDSKVAYILFFQRV